MQRHTHDQQTKKQEESFKLPSELLEASRQKLTEQFHCLRKLHIIASATKIQVSVIL